MGAVKGRIADKLWLFQRSWYRTSMIARDGKKGQQAITVSKNLHKKLFWQKIVLLNIYWKQLLNLWRKMFWCGIFWGKEHHLIHFVCPKCDQFRTTNFDFHIFSSRIDVQYLAFKSQLPVLCVLGWWYWVLGTGYWVLGTGYRIATELSQLSLLFLLPNHPEPLCFCKTIKFTKFSSA